jgi:hypothetical protein
MKGHVKAVEKLPEKGKLTAVSGKKISEEERKANHGDGNARKKREVLAASVACHGGE